MNSYSFELWKLCGVELIKEGLELFNSKLVVIDLQRFEISHFLDV